MYFGVKIMVFPQPKDGVTDGKRGALPGFFAFASHALRVAVNAAMIQIEFSLP